MKISLRNFFTMSVVMFAVFFLVMFSGTAKAVLTNYMENEYTGMDGENIGLESSDAYQVEESGDVASYGDGEYLIYVGKSEEAGLMVEEWCRYNRKGFFTYSSLDDIPELESIPQFIVIDGRYIDTTGEVQKLAALAESGADMIFNGMPSNNFINSQKKLRRLLGINKIRRTSVDITGQWLFEGFLLGGETVYDAETEEEEENLDLDLSVTWYDLSSGVTRYMVGLMDDETLEQYNIEDGIITEEDGEESEDESESGDTEEEDETQDADPTFNNERIPPIIWSATGADSTVFCVNADYMESQIGLGLISAMEYEVSDYQLYSTVNAQCLSFVNFPTGLSENYEQLNGLYARDWIVMSRDLIWPGITSVATANDSLPTCYVTRAVNDSVKGDVDDDSFDYAFRLLREIDGEAGICAVAGEGSTLEESLAEDYEFFTGILPDYEIQSAYIGSQSPAVVAKALKKAGFTNVSIYEGDMDAERGCLSFIENGVFVSATHNGISHTSTEDLLEKSLETALGYTDIVTDISSVLYPEDEDDEWQNFYDYFSSYTNTYWD
ncbi:MAG: hypothetical protein K5840_03215, partial [Eubacterium sp.]|nr:hypothetical protein [Eubacterium sp.]